MLDGLNLWTFAGKMDDRRDSSTLFSHNIIMHVILCCEKLKFLNCDMGVSMLSG